MNRLKTYGLVGLAGVAVAATVDSALGLGGGAFLADICRTILDDGTISDGMGDMAMGVKPVPLIALSLIATIAAIAILTRDQRRVRSGQSVPDDAERSAILSAMILVATTHGRTSRSEIMDVFRIVTGHPLEEELADLTCKRFAELKPTELRMYSLPRLETSIARRRTIAAALMVGCVVRPAAAGVNRLIERIAFDVKATSEDVAAARKALSEWQDDISPVDGISLIALLRHRVLRLRPA
ncbi:MAG: hypothetical protein LJE62_16890 [Silicimonas sp.]|nr:hypothetical protein [Silicimonas sp.]